MSDYDFLLEVEELGLALQEFGTLYIPRTNERLLRAIEELENRGACRFMSQTDSTMRYKKIA